MKDYKLCFLLAIGFILINSSISGGHNSIPPDAIIIPIERAQYLLDEVESLLSKQKIPKHLSPLLNSSFDLDEYDDSCKENLTRYLIRRNALEKHLNVRLENYLPKKVKPYQPPVYPPLFTAEIRLRAIRNYSYGSQRDYYLFKNGSEFDPTSLLSILDKISIADGYILDYVYFCSMSNGWPCLYARRRFVPPLIAPEFVDLLTETTHIKQNSYIRYMNCLKADGSAESFFQLAIFRVLGEQFYLYWHACYNDLTPVCVPWRLKGFLSTVFESEYLAVWPKHDHETAKQINFTPYVILKAETATVVFIGTTNWGGIIRFWWTVKRDFPHEEVKLEKQVLVPYDCGMEF